jgi:sialate O-acetylesterase
MGEASALGRAFPGPMRIPEILCPGIALAAAFAAALTCSADGPAAGPPQHPFLSPIFGDNMVLQRGKVNRFWGWTKPGNEVRVEVEGKAASGVAATDGKWSVAIEVPPAGGPYSVKIHGEQEIELHNVLVGDVWLCGGQSNMLLGLGATDNGAAEIKAADHPDLRLYLVAGRSAYSPAPVPAGSWKVCTPATVGEGGDRGFSAVAYYFARRIQGELHIPVGLIEDCSGGSTVEAWMSPEKLTSLGEFAPQIAAIGELRAKGGPEYGSFLMHWLDDYDPGAKGGAWAAPGFDDAGWKTVDVPGAFSELGVEAVPCVCWFRREITLPDPVPPGQATIYLGPVEKMDTTFINGHWIGASSWVENPRVYHIPAGVLRPGANLVALRVFKVKPVDGFLAKPEVLRIELGDGSSVALAGKWRGTVSVDARPPHPMPMDLENYPTMPIVFYEGMIAPLAPLAITGVIWYQGEANTTRAVQYRKLLPALIADWRSLFGQGDFPFYIVSLPLFTPHRSEPGDDGWAELREVQARTASTLANSGLAVTIDTGEADNIHPKQKKVVGDRLALCALAEYYHLPVAYRGPTFTAAETLPGALRLRFANVGGGLVVHGPKLGEFSVAGADRKWSWADARIDGDTVVVSSPSVPEPVAARYAWQANPAATLYNDAGLPAVPFRTDDWPFR